MTKLKAGDEGEGGCGSWNVTVSTLSIRLEGAFGERRTGKGTLSCLSFSLSMLSSEPEVASEGFE